MKYQKFSDVNQLTGGRIQSKGQAFILSVACMLAATAIIKIISAMQESRYLEEVDPILTLFKNRHILILSAILEILVAARLFWVQAGVEAQLTVFWLSAVFAAYHAAFWLLDIQKPCSCLGGALNWIGVYGAWPYIIPFF
jgi:hypothetical protein